MNSFIILGITCVIFQWVCIGSQVLTGSNNFLILNLGLMVIALISIAKSSTLNSENKSVEGKQ